jgi:cellulose synthase/poly-beta-1,6-N-acetylglucosamine synthase-like glycosyltransferase
MFEIIFLIVLSLYFIQSFIFTIGVGKRFEKLPDDKLPLVSVIVAARNEEDNILDCLNSLNTLIYLEDRLEVIVVNDHSTDGTEQIITDFIKDKPKFKTMVPSKQFGEVKGKANAIANAVEISTGEVIITTDADCTVSPQWAKTLASYYVDDVALVCGFTTQDEFNVFAGMQAVDFIYLLAVASGSMNLGKPLSCIGNNMSYRKSVYDEIGGYSSIPFSITEDFKLMFTIHNNKKYKVIYPLDEESLISSKPCPSLKSLAQQKKRWGVGGLDSELTGFGVMSAAFLTHIAILVTPFFFSLPALYLIVFKIIIDYFFLLPIYKKLKLKLVFKHFLVFEFYYLFYVILLPISLIFSRKVKWKGRDY